MTGDPLLDTFTVIMVGIIIFVVAAAAIGFVIFYWKLFSGLLDNLNPKKYRENVFGEKGEVDLQGKERKNKASPIEMKERMIREGTIEVFSEQVPLNNSAGNSTLISEHEFECKATSTLKLEKNSELESKIHAGLWSVLEGEARSQISAILGVEIGTEITRRIKVKFEAPPRKIVHYRITWKQMTRRGLLEVKTQNGIIHVPYSATYGLSHSVDSVPLLR